MNKYRLEAFSDGVFAIAITLLILDIRIPDVDYDELPNALLEIAPRILSYVMSFILIGAYWIFHHFYFDRVSKVNGTFLWMNIFALLLISFMPFPTSLMGRYPLKPLPLVIYGVNLMATNVMGFLSLLYVYKHPEYTNERFSEKYFKEQIPSYIWINSFYLLALILAFIYPVISYSIYVGILVAICLMIKKRINNSLKDN